MGHFPSSRIPARSIDFVKNATQGSFREPQDGIASQNCTLEEGLFRTLLAVERRRAERSHKPFVLMLLNANRMNGGAERILRKSLEVVAAYKRESDLLGWYSNNSVLGVIFTEVSMSGETPITETLYTKIKLALINHLGRETAANIAISLHIFPESADGDNSASLGDSKLYPEINQTTFQRRMSFGVKRAIDILVSAAFLVLFSPLYATIALLVKLTSKGPALFEQQRLGQFGKQFKCFKFRTMYVGNDSKIHQDYVREFIAGKGRSEEQQSTKTVFKIANDPRVTPIGGWLRKTSLDELPQFWNVLRGEMSLVGPRPPLPYEFKMYDLWHRRRVMEVKPGITGLWQVNGRSRTRFDEMVRLDLRYCQTWSLWLDLKILLATPKAVFTGDGAY